MDHVVGERQISHAQRSLVPGVVHHHDDKFVSLRGIKLPPKLHEACDGLARRESVRGDEVCVNERNVFAPTRMRPGDNAERVGACPADARTDGRADLPIVLGCGATERRADPPEKVPRLKIPIPRPQDCESALSDGTHRSASRTRLVSLRRLPRASRQDGGRYSLERWPRSAVSRHHSPDRGCLASMASAELLGHQRARRRTRGDAQRRWSTSRRFREELLVPTLTPPERSGSSRLGPSRWPGSEDPRRDPAGCRS